MNEAFVQKSCTPCRGGIPPLTNEEAENFRSQVPAWDLLDDAHRIERRFRFRDFKDALSFVEQVGQVADKVHTVSDKINDVTRGLRKLKSALDTLKKGKNPLDGLKP